MGVTPDGTSWLPPTQTTPAAAADHDFWVLTLADTAPNYLFLLHAGTDPAEMAATDPSLIQANDNARRPARPSHRAPPGQ